MDQPEQKPENKESIKTSTIPPWKLPQKHLRYDSEPENSGSKKEKKPSHTKWVLITILLLLVTNTLTAGYFLIKSGRTVTLPKNGLESPRSVGSQSKSSLSYNPFLPDYGATLGKANDTKRKADLTAISTALNQYIVEYGTENFPTNMQCIGTSAGCYDLASILTPEYFLTVPIDSVIGSQINTGYSFYWSGAQGFILEAQGEDGQPITIIR